MTRRLSRLLSALVLVWQAHGQSTDAGPAFEVAAIKPADPAATQPGKGRLLPGGRIEVPGMTLKNMIMFAYGVQENMIGGGPKWAENERFDIVAKAAAETPMPTMRLMFQNLLADRFQLTLHREEKPMPAYVLVLGKRELKLQQGDGGRQTCDWSNPGDGLRRRTCHNLTMGEFANQLPGLGGVGIDLPVVDQTGLKGPYDFHFEVGTPGRSERERPAEGAASVPVDSGPTIFTALDQVGLKLESKKIPLAMIVIDRAEHPKEN